MSPGTRAVVLGAGGGFGRLLARMLGEAGATVVSVDLEAPCQVDRVLVADAVHPSPELVTELGRCDLVVLCLPERALFPALEPVLAPLRPGTLVVDITSVKTRYAAVVAALRDDLELCSLEPLFAPDVGFAGQDLLVAALRGGPRTEAFVRLLRGSGADVALVDAEFVDRQAAVSQVAAHAMLLAYGDALGPLGFDPDGPTTALQRVLLALVARICTRDPDVYWHIQRDNPYAPGARRAVADRLRALAERVESGDQEAFTAAVRATADSLGTSLTAHAERSAAVVAAAAEPSTTTGWAVLPAVATMPRMHRIFTTSFASVYPHYVTKVEKKGRTRAELDQVIEWLTGFDDTSLQTHLDDGTTFQDFFAAARLNPNVSLITGTVCGVRVEDIEDPLMQQVRYLDKLVDELAKGRAIQKILRS